MERKAPVILVVDDEAETRKYVSLNLKIRKYEVVTAGGGAEALQKLKEHQVDLVLLDISMPEMDGFQVCSRLREISDIPIIMVSARGRERDKLTALGLGANDYMTKPFGVQELLMRVQAALSASAT